MQAPGTTETTPEERDSLLEEKAGSIGIVDAASDDQSENIVPKDNIESDKEADADDPSREGSNIADGVINGFSTQTMFSLTGPMVLSRCMGFMQSDNLLVTSVANHLEDKEQNLSDQPGGRPGWALHPWGTVR